MKYLRRFRTVITIVMISITTGALVLFLVGRPSPPDPTTLQRIEYRFTDSSVPPEYHRSYAITITTQEAAIVVDSYGDILAEERYIITEEQFRKVGQSLVDNHIRHVRSNIDDSCPGGTTETVAYADSGGELFRAHVYHCGTSGSGSLGGDTTAFGDDVRQLIPDFDTLIETPL